MTTLENFPHLVRRRQQIDIPMRLMEPILSSYDHSYKFAFVVGSGKNCTIPGLRNPTDLSPRFATVEGLCGRDRVINKAGQSKG